MYEWVDLGLPSGIKWAAWNVGATKPEEYGLYFAWGETEGYSGITEDKRFLWNDYKFGTQDNLTKYNATDGLTQLELVDDAAYQSDNTCRMPSKAELEELTANTTSTWETLNGVNGIRFTSNTNDNSIFVPAAGNCHYNSVNGVGSAGYLWSSSLKKGSLSSAWLLNFGSSGASVYELYRFSGYSIRPIKE